MHRRPSHRDDSLIKGVHESLAFGDITKEHSNENQEDDNYQNICHCFTSSNMAAVNLLTVVAVVTPKEVATGLTAINGRQLATPIYRGPRSFCYMTNCHIALMFNSSSNQMTLISWFLIE